MSDQWSSLLLGLAQDATLVEVKAAVEALANSGLATDAELVLVKQAVEALANSGLATDAELVLVKDAVTALANSGLATEVKQDELIAAINALANSGLATEAEQIAARLQQALRDNRCATLIDFIKQPGEQLHHYEDPVTGDRFHLRAPAGTGYTDALWEVVHFDNVNGKTKCMVAGLEDENGDGGLQVYTDHAPVPEEDTADYAVASTAPYAWYKMDAMDTDDSLTDYSGNDRHGFYVARDDPAPDPGAEPPYGGTAISRGSSGSRTMPNHRAIGVSGVNPQGWTEFTVSMWVRLKHAGGDPSQNLLDHKSFSPYWSDGSDKFFFRISTPEVGSGGNNLEYSPPTPTNGDIFHLVHRWKGSTYTEELFVDGVLVSTDTHNTKQGTLYLEYEHPTPYVLIGGHWDAIYRDTYTWHGDISDVTFWDRRLTDEEIASLYEATKL